MHVWKARSIWLSMLQAGVIDVYIDPDSIEIIMADTGPGIADIEKPGKRDILQHRKLCVTLGLALVWACLI